MTDQQDTDDCAAPQVDFLMTTTTHKHPTFPFIEVHLSDVGEGETFVASTVDGERMPTNLNAMMKRLVLGRDWAARRMKARPRRAPRAPADRATFGKRSRPDPRRARRHPFPATGAERMIARLLPPVLQTPPGSAGHGLAVTAGSGRDSSTMQEGGRLQP
jgi:hypothetical protein